MELSHSENIILRYIIENPVYLETCLPSYFSNESLGEIMIVVSDFWKRYHEIPKCDQVIESFKIQGKTELVTPDEIRSLYNVNLKSYEEVWLTETTEFFIEYKTLTKSAVDGLKYIQSTPVDSESIRGVIDNFKRIILERNNIDFNFDEGLDFFNPSNHKQLSHRTFSSGYPFIDTVLGGGFSAKALYVFMGMPKVGKTLWMGNIAIQGMKKGNNVAIISLEMGDRKLVKRLGANLLNIPISEYNKISEDEELIKKKLNNLTYDNFSVPGQFLIKEFPTSQASVNDIENYLKKVEEMRGIKFKIVVIDYINIMKNWRNPNSENTYMKIKQIAEDLRGMAVRNEWAIITGTQTKQGDFDASDLSINSAAESSGLVATVDGMFGIIQDPIMYSNGEYKLKILANREDGYKNSYKVFNVDYKYMRIIEDISKPMHNE
jgi:archaellum biogenesis ATPase FlaH